MLNSVSHISKLKTIDIKFRIAITDMCIISESACWTHRFRSASLCDTVSTLNSKDMTQNISLDSISFVFRFTASVEKEFVRLLRRWNSEFNVFQHQMWAVYKCKTDKVQLIN